MLRRVNDYLESLLRFAGGCLFVVFIGAIFLQVIARNYLKISVVWTDEVALLAFVWSVFLGAAVALRRRLHYVVEVLPGRLVTVNNALRLFASVISLAVIYVFIVNGWIFTEMGLRRTSVALGTPLAYVFAAIPVAGAAMAIFSVEIILEDIRHLRHRTKPGSEGEEGLT